MPLEYHALGLVWAGAGLFVGLAFHSISRRALTSENRRLAQALKAAPANARAMIASDYVAQIGVFTDGITQARVELQNVDVGIARQKSALSGEGGRAPLGAPDERARLELDRTLAKRAYLKQSIDGLVQRKVGWLEAERLIQVAGYAKDAWLAARCEIDAELARIDAGQMELRQTAAGAIEEIKQDHQKAAQRSEILDSQRHEVSTRTHLSR